MNTCVVHADTTATTDVLGIAYCTACVVSLTETMQGWSAEREAATDDPYVCCTVGCGQGPAYRTDGRCTDCQKLWQAKQAAIRNEARLRARRRKASEARALDQAWGARTWLQRLRPCSRCGTDRAGCNYPEPVCRKCRAEDTARRRKDTAYAASSRRRARKRSATHEPYKRSEIFARWDNLCCYCDAQAEHLDHVNPLSKGGADAAHNLVPACAPCNLTKSAKTLAEWASTFTMETR